MSLSGSYELVRACFLSLLPAGFWMWYVAWSSPRRVPRDLLVLVLGAGALSPLPVLGLGWLVEESGLSWMRMPDSPAGQLVFFVLSVGLVEESSKFLAVWLTAYRSSRFREPWDGLLYSTASALGFATTENVKYVLGFGDPTILLGRSLLATFGHVLMSACWGYSLGLQRSDPGRYRLVVLQGLAWAALGHGAFDFFLSMGWPLGAVGVLGMLFWLFRIRVGESVLGSAFRIPRQTRVVECPACHSLVRRGSRFCTACGLPLEADLKLHCGHCLEAWQGDQPVCDQCGAVALDRPAVQGLTDQGEVGEDGERKKG